MDFLRHMTDGNSILYQELSLQEILDYNIQHVYCNMKF